MGPYSVLLSINACLHILKYDYEFLTCILTKMTFRKKKAPSRSLKCHPSLPLPHPLRYRSPFRGGAKKRITFQTRHVGVENLRNFRAPLVFEAKIFCSSGNLKQVLHFWATFGQNAGLCQARKSEQFHRKCQVRLNRSRISASFREFKKPQRLRRRKHHFKLLVWAILSISRYFHLVYVVQYGRSML